MEQPSQENKDQQNKETRDGWENAKANWDQLLEQEEKKDWDHWNSNASHNSYYNQPTHTPYNQAFSAAALILGLLSVTLGFVGLSIPFGALGMIMASLCMRKRKKAEPGAQVGMILSAIGMITGVFFICYVVYMIFNNPSFLEQLNQTSQLIYGADFSEILEKSYGITVQ